MGGGGGYMPEVRESRSPLAKLECGFSSGLNGLLSDFPLEKSRCLPL